MKPEATEATPPNGRAHSAQHSLIKELRTQESLAFLRRPAAEAPAP